MKKIKKVLAIFLTTLIMLSLTTALASAMSEERTNAANYSRNGGYEEKSDFKITKRIEIGEDDYVSIYEILNYISPIEGANDYSIESLYDIASQYDESGNLIGFGYNGYNGLDLVCVYRYINIYGHNGEIAYSQIIGTDYFLLVINSNGEAMGSIESMSVDNRTFKYKSENNYLFTNVNTKNDEGAYCIEYYICDDYSDNGPYVYPDGYVDTYYTGKVSVTCYVVDADGNVVNDSCVVTVKMSVFQWIIKYLCFGWLWGF